MQFDSTPLSQKHTRLLPMEATHASALYDAGRHPEIWNHLPARMNCFEDMTRLVENALQQKARGDEFPFVVEEIRTGRIVGSTRYCDIQPAHRNLEVGWTWLTPDVWRTPINTECKYLLLQNAFETLGVVRVCLKTDARNIRSQRAIERLGAVKEGVLRQHRILPDGFVRDSVYYSILDREWPVVKEGLERRMAGISG